MTRSLPRAQSRGQVFHFRMAGGLFGARDFPSAEAASPTIHDTLVPHLKDVIMSKVDEAVCAILADQILKLEQLTAPGMGDGARG